MKKIHMGSSSVLTFTFLLSGSVIHNLYYSSGNPIISYICISAFLLVFTLPASKWFAGRKNISDTSFSGFFAVISGIFMLLPMAYTVSVYGKSLGTFAEYYSKVQVVVFAVLAVTVSGMLIALKGRIAVNGFARMTVPIMLVCILAGFLGFFHTKNLVPLDSPFERFNVTDVSDIIKNAALITLDTVILFVYLSDNKSAEEKKHLPKQVFSGVAAFVAVSGINMLKNVFMFGTEFLTRLDNPDLAAIRLIPMFELPEISVPVNTFAAVVRISVYLCALFFMLKDAFGQAYCTKKASACVLCAVSAAAFAIIYLVGDVRAAGYFCVLSAAVCAVFCIAFFAAKEKNKPGDDM